MTETWFHGGKPGLTVGDLILPPDATGTTRRLSTHATLMGAAYGTRTDVVYLARYQDHARVFAAFYPDGALYQVAPASEVEPDPDAPEHSAMAASATVTAVIRPQVVMAHRRLDSWMRMLQNTPGEHNG